LHAWTISLWGVQGTAGARGMLLSSFHCVALNTLTWHAWARARTHTRTERLDQPPDLVKEHYNHGQMWTQAQIAAQDPLNVTQNFFKT
jgi:hypothetical protein